MTAKPSVETLGYSRMSLRDSDRRPGQGNFRKALNLNRILVDAQDTPENRHFFTQLKGRLKPRLEQLDIWLTVHPIEVL
jgi:hypothetical protein